MAIEQDLTDVVQDASVPLTTDEYHEFDDLRTTQTGPTINGQQTTLTLFSPSQLAQSDFLESFQAVANKGFTAAHVRSGVLPSDIERVRSRQYLLDEIGNLPGTFTYTVHFNDTDVLATATMRRFKLVSTIETPGMSDDDIERLRRHRSFYRLQELPPGVKGWELKMMVVDSAAQGQGLAGLLIDLCEKEARRRSKLVAEPAKELRFVLTCIAEINEQFYIKKGFTEDYRTWMPVGTMGSETGFHILHMSKSISMS